MLWHHFNRHGSSCLYSWWHHHLATRIHVFMPKSTHIATGVLAFIPDSTIPFHWESSYLCLIASPWPGWKSRWCCHRNPLFIPDRTFWKSVNFQPSRMLKNRGKSIVFSTHCSGLPLGNSLSTFRHKQDPSSESQITQYVVVGAFNGQNLTTICRFLAFPRVLHRQSTSSVCVFIAYHILIFGKV